MKHTLCNSHITITVDSRGAELNSLKRRSDNKELLWQGDKTYWGGQSPILFPVVGNTYKHEVRFEGNLYEMPKHGFVRQADFTLVQKTEEQLVFQTGANEKTREHYPFDFMLTVYYTLSGNTLLVSFEISNPQDTPLYYQIGAHPAFNLPDFDAEQEDEYGYLGFNIKNKLVSNGLKPGGYLWPEGSFDVMLDANGLLPLRPNTFECDTLLDSRALAHTCVLYNRNKKAIVDVKFDAPILALWAPCGGRAPFVCIEPWWGSCDIYGYEGEFKNRYCINTVTGRATKRHEYTITVNAD